MCSTSLPRGIQRRASSGARAGTRRRRHACPDARVMMARVRRPVMKRRKIIVNIGTSADGFIARPDGDLEWLTSRPAPRGFYGMGAFVKSIDTKVLGRKTYEASLRLGAKFEPPTRYIVFSRETRPAGAPLGVEFVSEAIGPFMSGLREQPGKDIW